MLSRKAISRELQAHFVVESALLINILIEEESIDISSFASLFDVLAGEADRQNRPCL